MGRGIPPRIEARRRPGRHRLMLLPLVWWPMGLGKPSHDKFLYYWPYLLGAEQLVPVENQE